MSISTWLAHDTSGYYTYIRAARYLGMPFYTAEAAIKAHAPHIGYDMRQSVNTLPVRLVESLPTCEHCRKASEAA